MILRFFYKQTYGPGEFYLGPFVGVMLARYVIAFDSRYTNVYRW